MDQQEPDHLQAVDNDGRGQLLGEVAGFLELYSKLIPRGVSGESYDSVNITTRRRRY
jgi:hypothetical protein